ncbi:hypothetical protein FHU36_004240 [Nonomuraea muscovyensis]|uniref:OmpR/PhoB-type domain-containing protein n=1 Tax=Nonomuraea muscovyensis TaxID=1124761 RepID=A0A7X0C358_9ACTN|nr:BTAD domain-containing putative transcriptional regulator [Nonomuraea muscovyensis]MBB6347695.1 hypothetical protein [Nonomuraea muscovyensis]
MRFGILGPVQAWADGERVVAVGGPGVRALAALLLLDAGTVVPAGHLIDGLYGTEVPVGAANALQSRVARLRSLLGPGLVISHPGGYRMAAAPEQVDAHRFQCLARLGHRLLREGQHMRAAATLDEALVLWRGPALADVGGAPFAYAQSARLEETRLGAVEDPSSAARVAARPPHARAVGSGPPGGGIGRVRGGTQDAGDELGADPSPELAAVHTSLLLGSSRRGQGPTHAEAAAATQGPKRSRIGLLPRARPVPDMMPGDTSDFTGRLDEVTRIGRALAGDGRAGSAVPVVAVVGRAGIGKTALAVHVAHGIGGSFPDGRLFADLHAGADRRPSPAQVLERFLRALGLPGPAIPDGLGERAEVYRTLLAGRRMLVVLDEVHAESQVRPLLPGEPGWLQHGDAGVRAPLSLSPAGLGEDAKRLLRALAVLDSPDCPTWVGAALLDVREPVAQDLFDELADAQLVEVTGLGPFARYRLHDLVRLFARYRLHDLVRLFARYRLHDLVRLFARELPAPQDQVTALSRMVASLLYLVEQAAYREFGGGQPHLRGDTPSRPLPGPLTEQLLADPLAWFDSERAAVRSAVRQTGEAGLTSLCWDLARKAASFYKLRAYRDDWRETHETAPAVARRAGDKRGVAAIHVSTAELLLGTDSNGEVRRELDAACALFEEIGHEYGLALAVRDLALLDRLEGRHADAAACGERALELLRRTGTPVDVAYVLMGLAHLKLECGQVDAAATLLEESLALSVGHGARRLRA